MNIVKNTFIALIAVLLLASCGESTKGGLTQFDACNCATVKDEASADYAKCAELRKDAAYEAAYQQCKLAIESGFSDTSMVSIEKAANAKNLKAAGDGLYNIDVATSSLTWRGENIVGKKHQGTIMVKRGSVNLSGGAITGGEIVIDMNTLTNTDLSGEEKGNIESHLKGADFFDTAKFSEAVYTITSGKPKNAIDYDVTGKLTIKGITHDLNCTLIIAANGEDIKIAGGFQFDRSQFDVRYGSDKFFDNLGNKAIKNDVVMTLNLEGKK